jgi:hypothetical protein
MGRANTVSCGATRQLANVRARTKTGGGAAAGYASRPRWASLSPGPTAKARLQRNP